MSMTLEALMSAAGMNGYMIQEQTGNTMIMASSQGAKYLTIHHDNGMDAECFGPDAKFIDNEARIQFNHLMCPKGVLL